MVYDETGIYTHGEINPVPFKESELFRYKCVKL